MGGKRYKALVFGIWYMLCNAILNVKLLRERMGEEVVLGPTLSRVCGQIFPSILPENPCNRKTLYSGITVCNVRAFTCIRAS